MKVDTICKREVNPILLCLCGFIIAGCSETAPERDVVILIEEEKESESFRVVEEPDGDIEEDESNDEPMGFWPAEPREGVAARPSSHMRLRSVRYSARSNACRVASECGTLISFGLDMGTVSRFEHGRLVETVELEDEDANELFEIVWGPMFVEAVETGTLECIQAARVDSEVMLQIDYRDRANESRRTILDVSHCSENDIEEWIDPFFFLVRSTIFAHWPPHSE